MVYGQSPHEGKWGKSLNISLISEANYRIIWKSPLPLIYTLTQGESNTFSTSSFTLGTISSVIHMCCSGIMWSTFIHFKAGLFNAGILQRVQHYYMELGKSKKETLSSITLHLTRMKPYISAARDCPLKTSGLDGMTQQQSQIYLNTF